MSAVTTRTLSGFSRLWRRACFILALLCLIYCVWNGVAGAWSQHTEAHTLGQQLQTALQALYGALSLAAIATVFRWRRWQVHVLVAWIAVVAISSGMAALAWGGGRVQVGLVTLAATAATAGLIAAMLRAGMHGFGLLRPR